MSASSRAIAGLRAAKNRRKWGIFAATSYAIKNGALREYAAACAFECRRRLRSEFKGYLA